MKILKNILSQFHTFLLWAMASVLLWSWIYTLVNDAPREKKVTVFINAVAIDDHALALRLEEHLPDGIRKIKVHDFEYGMIGTDVKGDIYVVRASQLEQMLREKPEAVLPITAPEGCFGYVTVFESLTPPRRKAPAAANTSGTPIWTNPRRRTTTSASARRPSTFSARTAPWTTPPGRSPWSSSAWKTELPESRFSPVRFFAIPPNNTG